MSSTPMNEADRLGDAMLAEAEAVGLRLRACVREALQRTLSEIPAARELAQETRLDGVVCKRVIKLLREGSGAAVLTHAPSPANLRELSDVLEGRMGLGPLEGFALRDAIGKFEKLLQAFGASKGELTRLLRAADGEPSAETVPAHAPLRYGAIDGGVIRALPGAESVGSVTDINPLEFDAASLAERLCGAAVNGVVVTWSGTPAPDLFARDPAVWSGEAFEALGMLCRDVAPRLREAGVRWLLRPHCRHALCDTQRCVNFLRTQISAGPVRQSIGLALDPVAMLENSMLDGCGGAGATPADYAARAIATLGPVSDLLILTGVQRSEGTGDAESEMAALAQRCPIGSGRIDIGELAPSITACRPFLGRLVVAGENPEGQIAILHSLLGADTRAAVDYTVPDSTDGPDTEL